MGRRDACPTFSEVTDQFEPLPLAARERVDGLAEAQITEPDFLEQREFFHRPPCRTGLPLGREKLDDLIHRRLEEVGDGPGLRSSRREEALTSSLCGPSLPLGVRKWSLLTSAATDFYFQNVRPIAATAAVGAADEHIAEELHLDLLETRAAAAFALALGGIEAERAGVEAALLRGVRLGEQFANVVERANVNGRVGARRFAERRLVHENSAPEMFR